MPAIVNSVFPKINFYNDTQIYKTFSVANSDFVTSCITSYGYRNSVKDFSGNFSISIAENDDDFCSKVSPLDIVEIYNDQLNSYPDFIGVVSNVTYTSRATGQRITTITGSDISYLFEFFNITFDSIAQAIVNKMDNDTAKNLAFTFTLNNQSDPCVSIKDAIEKSYTYFCQIAKSNYQLSNTAIESLINRWYNISGSSDTSYTGFVDVTDNVKFMLPIASNIFGTNLATFPSYVRNILPDNVYEFFSTMINGKPKLICREKPFDLSIGNTWKNLPLIKIDPLYLTDYTLTRSIDEVYNVFLPYIEGFSQSADFYAKIAAINGYSGVSALQDKVQKYGFKLLQTNFVGFNINLADDASTSSTLTENMASLCERMKDWYGHNDEFYNAEINCVYGGRIAKSGEKLSFLGGEFYVTDSEITWKYGSSPVVRYSCERGAKYIAKPDGTLGIETLEGFSKKYSEVSL